MTAQEAIDILSKHERYIGIKYVNGIEETYINSCLKEAITVSISTMQELKQYKQLGTIEELRDATEKQHPMKPNKAIETSWGIKREVHVCPVCDYYLPEINFIGDGEKVSYCEVCGQAIDWERSETE